MALYFCATTEDGDSKDFEWHVGELVPLFSVDDLTELHADGHEAAFLLNDLHVEHSYFLCRGSRSIHARSQNYAILVYGMMLHWQAVRLFDK